MSSSTVCLLFVFCGFLYSRIVLSEGCYYNMIHHAVPLSEGESPEAFGKPLYINKRVIGNDAERARYASAVYKLPNASLEIKALKSYSGFLTVDDIYHSSLFFWFFPAMHSDVNAPFIIWLQGGPGFSSMIGVFAEHGPLEYDHKKGQVNLREHTWVKKFNMLYIDSPVGTGFSHTNSEKGYARDQKTISTHLLKALDRFFSVFSEYKSNGIFLAGEGYACKTVLTLADELHSIDGGEHKLDIQGVIIGNGICSWGALINQTAVLKHSGLIDRFQAKEMLGHIKKIDHFFRIKAYVNASEKLSDLYRDKPTGTSLFRKMTGYESLYDYTNPKIPESLYIYTEYLAMVGVRKSLHVGSVPFGNHDTVCHYLVNDMGSGLNYRQVANVFNNYKVLMYHGRRDALSSYGSFKSYVSAIKWDKADHAPRNFFWYRKVAPKNTWTGKNKDKKFVGRVRQVGEFTTVTLWNAGHFAVYDDPLSAEDMVNRFVYGRSFLSF